MITRPDLDPEKYDDRLSSQILHFLQKKAQKHYFWTFSQYKGFQIGQTYYFDKFLEFSNPKNLTWNKSLQFKAVGLKIVFLFIFIEMNIIQIRISENFQKNLNV